VRQVFAGDFIREVTVTAWEPLERFAYRGAAFPQVTGSAGVTVEGPVLFLSVRFGAGTRSEGTHEFRRRR
jgi:hypothetical protein